mmetsp:Transcript_46787/g.141722  ORF Transcript_46787/g.141722 Transcript_46787/m.141722 type:complete len:273 (-) Transcript_46787:944-1762(-)
MKEKEALCSSPPLHRRGSRSSCGPSTTFLVQLATVSSASRPWTCTLGSLCGKVPKLKPLPRQCRHWQRTTRERMPSAGPPPGWKSTRSTPWTPCCSGWTTWAPSAITTGTTIRIRTEERRTARILPMFPSERRRTGRWNEWPWKPFPSPAPSTESRGGCGEGAARRVIRRRTTAPPAGRTVPRFKDEEAAPRLKGIIPWIRACPFPAWCCTLRWPIPSRSTSTCEASMRSACCSHCLCHRRRLPPARIEVRKLPRERTRAMPLRKYPLFDQE